MSSSMTIKACGCVITRWRGGTDVQPCSEHARRPQDLFKQLGRK